MNELHERLKIGGPSVAGEIKLTPFEGEITLPVYTRLNGEEYTIGTITLPVKLDVEIVHQVTGADDDADDA